MSSSGDFSVAASPKCLHYPSSLLIFHLCNQSPCKLTLLNYFECALFSLGTMTNAYHSKNWKWRGNDNWGHINTHLTMQPSITALWTILWVFPVTFSLSSSTIDSFSDLKNRVGNKATANSKPSQKCLIHFPTLPSIFYSNCSWCCRLCDPQSKAEVLS